eukprot:CAMPEP_0198133832 /NCGR_PEP_ID=MMETSP1442-20131203/59766_1 /TAXON_ID= /ORGANISM="Craspedostauros australis, Strain CCMP3328" /LENGTH=164 /DNA_ID=CAMNT_0043794967 /DNA_START=1030 /DNA_END=1523 /DNA_ORIENTATION=+
MADETKPEPENAPITIRVRDQTGEETFFKIKKTTKMQKVFDTYAQRKGVEASSLRFLLDGERIEADATPKTLELDDQDQIDCMLEQTGGFRLDTHSKTAAAPMLTDRRVRETTAETKRQAMNGMKCKTKDNNRQQTTKEQNTDGIDFRNKQELTQMGFESRIMV